MRNEVNYFVQKYTNNLFLYTFAPRTSNGGVAQMVRAQDS